MSAVGRDEFDELAQRVASLERQASAIVALLAEQVTTIVPRLRARLDNVAGDVQRLSEGIADAFDNARAERREELSAVVVGLSEHVDGRFDSIDRQLSAILHRLGDDK